MCSLDSKSNLRNAWLYIQSDFSFFSCNYRLRCVDISISMHFYAYSHSSVAYFSCINNFWFLHIYNITLRTWQRILQVKIEKQASLTFPYVSFCVRTVHRHTLVVHIPKCGLTTLNHAIGMFIESNLMNEQRTCV